MQMPESHPFNPLGLLRLAVACGHKGEPNRHVCETIFRHVWQGGARASDTQRLTELTQKLAPPLDAQDPAVKARLKANTDEAIALGLFGVPSFVVDDKVFWGFDALPMLQAYLAGDPWFAGPWDAAASVAQGVRR